jgi:hypothetical protein
MPTRRVDYDPTRHYHDPPSYDYNASSYYYPVSNSLELRPLP